jgi:hypothetical protein
MSLAFGLGTGDEGASAERPPWKMTPHYAHAYELKELGIRGLRAGGPLLQWYYPPLPPKGVVLPLIRQHPASIPTLNPLSYNMSTQFHFSWGAARTQFEQGFSSLHFTFLARHVSQAREARMRLRFWPVEASGEFPSSLCWWSACEGYGGEARGSIAPCGGCANAGESSERGSDGDLARQSVRGGWR